MIRLISAVLLTAAAVAQQVEAPRMARVSGRVVNQAGEPVRRAVVKLLGNAIYSQTANAEGVFVLDQVQPGAYSLVASGSGYAVQKYGAEGPLVQHCPNYESVAGRTGNPVSMQYVRRCTAGAPGATLSLAAGQELKDLRIKLTPNATISGRVLNQDGEPVRGWSVELVKVKPIGGEQTGVLQSSTNVDGEFALANAVPGRYYLYASKGVVPNMMAGLIQDRQKKALPEIDLPTYYPGGAAIGRTAPIEVKPGDELSGLIIHLRRGRVYAIRGRVVAAPNSGVGDQSLTLASKDWPSGLVMDRFTMVYVDGSFEFRDLTPGAYVITGGLASSKLGVAPLYMRAEVNVTSSDIEGLTLTAVPTLELRGTMRLEDGKRAGGWPTIGWREVGGNLSFGATPDEKGAFALRNRISLSKYVVSLSSVPDGIYVKSIRYGGQDVLRAPLDLTGGAAGSLDIVLSSKVATITGAVKNAKDEPVAGVVVSVWPGTPLLLGGVVRTASTDQKGAFEITDLGPGEYFAAAWEEVDSDFLEVHEFLARFRDVSTAVRLEEGGQAHAELTPITKERVAAEAAKLP